MVDQITVGISQGSQGPQGLQGPGGPVGGLTYATAAALSAAAVPVDNTLAYIRGYAANEDGGGGYFRYSAGSAATVDGGLILSAAGGVGRWLRQYSGFVSVRWFGAKGDGVTDDTAAIQAALTAGANGSVYVPKATYIVAPSGSTTWLKISSNTILYGDGFASIIKVKNNAGNYETIFGGPTLGAISNVTIRDLCVDQNPSGNTTCNITAGDITTSQYIARFATTSSNIRIEHCLLKCCGTNAIVVTGNGPGTDIWILNNTLNWSLAHTTQPAPTYYDVTPIYIAARRVTIQGNTITAAIADHMDTGIQISNGGGVVQGNNIQGASTGITVTNSDYAPDDMPDTGTAVIGNTLTQCRYGVQLWSNGGHPPLKNVTVQGNTVQVAQLTWNFNASAGIYITDNITTTGNYENITINGNTISFETGDTRTVDQNGSAISGVTNHGIGLKGYTGTITGVTVVGNTIKDSPCHGIYIGNPGTSNTLTGIVVGDNTVVDCGRNSSLVSGSRAGIEIPGIPVVDVLISGNRIIDTGAPNGFYAFLIVPSSATRVRLANNHITPTLATSVDRTKVSDGYNTATLDFPSIAAGATSAALTITLIGVTGADAVYATPNFGLESGLTPIVWTGTDLVNIKLYNGTSGAIDPAARGWRVVVIKPGAGA